MSCCEDVDRVGSGLDKRAGPFISITVEALLSPLLEEVQELQEIFCALLNALMLENATGDQLRLLGERVLEFPLGDSDEDYRLRIKLKIRAASSAGTDNDYFELLELLGDDLVWRKWETEAWVSVTLDSGSVAFSPGHLHRILAYAASAGVDVRLIAPSEGEESSSLMSFPSFDAAVSGTNWPSFDGAVAGADWAATWSD